MLRHYVHVAGRHLRRHLAFASINVIGLTVGIASALLIGAFVRHELVYDRQHENADRIFRVTVEGRLVDQDIKVAVTPAPLAESMIESFPSIVATTRFWSASSGSTIQYRDQRFVDEKVAYADSSVFDVFTLPMVAGDPATALVEPAAAVVSRSRARAFFHNEDPLDQTIRIGSTDYRVTGVMEDIPETSHFHFDLLLSMSTLESSRSPSWLESNFYTYLLLNTPESASSVLAGLPGLVERTVGVQLEAAIGVPFADFQSGGGRFAFALQPLRSIHLNSHLDAELEPNGDIKYVYILSFVAIFVLIIACINFMNLATARAADRGREIGMRKVAGANRGQLVFQQLVETIVLSVVATILAIFVVEIVKPFFTTVADVSVALPYTEVPWFIPGLFGLALLVGILAGVYPALFLTAFRPADVLKKASGGLSRGGTNVRRGLVVFQFAMSIILISSTVIVFRQLSFMRNENLGFDRDQLLVVSNASALGGQIESFRDRIARMPGVEMAAYSSKVPGRDPDNTSFRPDGAPPESVIPIRYVEVSDDYAQTMKMELVDGRFLSKDRTDDENAVVLNEAAVHRAGWSEGVGKKIIILSTDPSENRAYTVVGVVRDFNFESLRHDVKPLAMMLDAPYGSVPDYLTVRLAGGDPARVIGALSSQWRQAVSEEPFSSYFLDGRLESLYESDRRLGRLFLFFAIIAILVACLGLFGLAAFVAERRMREIGIRKVLGSSVAGVTFLLTSDFVKLLLFSLVLAIPVAYLVMNDWLSGFAYHISPGVVDFAVAGFLTLVLAVVTVGYVAVRAALANPVDSLRYE